MINRQIERSTWSIWASVNTLNLFWTSLKWHNLSQNWSVDDLTNSWYYGVEKTDWNWYCGVFLSWKQALRTTGKVRQEKSVKSVFLTLCSINTVVPDTTAGPNATPSSGLHQSKHKMSVCWGVGGRDGGSDFQITILNKHQIPPTPYKYGVHITLK